MNVHLAYGENGLDVEFPEDAVVFHPRDVAGLLDEGRAVAEALVQPLGSPALPEVVSAGDDVVIVVSDVNISRGVARHPGVNP